jgi:hypothetical protein
MNETASRDQDAVMVGGPNDGVSFDSEGVALVEIEADDGLVHQYIRTKQARDGRAVFNYDGVIDPSGAMDGAETSRKRLMSPLARRADSER